MTDKNSADSVILEELFKFQDIKYRDFTSRLSPGVSFIGVRLPTLKKISKALLKRFSCDRITTNISSDMYFEELYVRGYCIACSSMPLNIRFEKIQKFISCIHGWSNCDSFCSLLKECISYKNEYHEFIMSIYRSPKSPYEIRFVLVMLIMYFAFEDRSEEIIELVEKTDCSHYYVSMAAAWLMATLYCRCSDKIKLQILKLKTDRLTYIRTLNKILESKLPSYEQKMHIRSLKKELGKN